MRRHHGIRVEPHAACGALAREAIAVPRRAIASLPSIAIARTPATITDNPRRRMLKSLVKFLVPVTVPVTPARHARACLSPDIDPGNTGIQYSGRNSFLIGLPGYSGQAPAQASPATTTRHAA